MSMSSTSSASLARSLVDSPFATDCKVLPAICSVSSQISKEAPETFVHTSIFTIRSGRVMKFFKRSIKDHKIAAFVRFLEFHRSIGSLPVVRSQPDAMVQVVFTQRRTRTSSACNSVLGCKRFVSPSK